MSLVLLFHYLLLNMFRMLVHPSSGACDLLWIYFMCCIALARCVLVLRCGSAGWCGILMQAEVGVTGNPYRKMESLKEGRWAKEYEDDTWSDEMW